MTPPLHPEHLGCQQKIFVLFTSYILTKKLIAATHFACFRVLKSQSSFYRNDTVAILTCLLLATGSFLFSLQSGRFPEQEHTKDQTFATSPALHCMFTHLLQRSWSKEPVILKLQALFHLVQHPPALSSFTGELVFCSMSEKETSR